MGSCDQPVVSRDVVSARTIVAMALLCAITSGCSASSLRVDEAHSAHQPSHGMPGGGEQSPIDLPERGVPNPKHRVALRYHETMEHIIHREHTVEVEVDAGSTIDFDGKTYTLEQFHFHTPSEHLVAGRRYPAELHLVHHDTGGEVLVVGVLFEVGDPSPFLERILRDAPARLGRVDRSETLSAANLFPAESHYYSYRGSFTTPPFTEGVDWLVLKTRLEASADQLVRLLVLEGGNAREIQERNDRTVDDF